MSGSQRHKTAKERRKENRARRNIDPVRWKPGHDPNDDDAHPDSGWEYAKIIENEVVPEGPKVTGTGGPEAGMLCFTCGLQMRVIQTFHPKEMLDYAVTEQNLVIPKDVDRVCILKCANEHAMQFRESLLPVATRLGL